MELLVIVSYTKPNNVTDWNSIVRCRKKKGIGLVRRN